MNREEKKLSVATIREDMLSAGSVVVVQYKGLTVEQLTSLRASMRKAKASLRVAKNRLVKIALKGTDYEGISHLFVGPTAIAISADPVAAAKAAAEFAKNNDKLIIVGGGLGQQALDAARVDALAKLPSLDQLRGKIVGIINAPATRIAGVLQAPAGQLARVVNAYSQKQ